MATTSLLIQYLLTLLFLRAASTAPVQIVLDHYDDKDLNRILTVSQKKLPNASNISLQSRALPSLSDQPTPHPSSTTSPPPMAPATYPTTRTLPSPASRSSTPPPLPPPASSPCETPTAQPPLPTPS